jgi:hypothetical protein
MTDGLWVTEGTLRADPLSDEAKFREWLRTTDELPADVPGDDAWNHRSAKATWKYVTSPWGGRSVITPETVAIPAPRRPLAPETLEDDDEQEM